jgi:hypothetical protein
MTKTKTLSILEVAEILSTGNFRRFLSTIEHEHVECKRAPYQLREQLQKIELAKDVSALANARGGYLLLGIDTERNTTHQGDEITKLCCFEQNMVDLDQYRKILDELIYPAIRDLKTVWHPWSEDASKGIVAIAIPAECRQNRPYLVAQTVVEAKVTGKLLGFYERIESNATPTTVQELRERMKDGMRFAQLDTRLANLEQLAIRQQSDSPAQPVEYSFEKLFQRAVDGRMAAGLEDTPSFFLLAHPDAKVQFENLFGSRQSSEVQLLENPPKDRPFGFNLDSDHNSAIIRGELRRRATPAAKCLELWRDGTLIFVARGDGLRLGWGAKDDEHGWRINNIALAETIYLFLRMTIQMLGLAKPAPKRVRVYFGLWEASAGDKLFKLTAENLNAHFHLDNDWRIAPHKGKIFGISLDLENVDPAAEGFKLLTEIYAWFGFSSVQIPYTDNKSSPPRIDPTLYAGVKGS